MIKKDKDSAMTAEEGNSVGTSRRYQKPPDASHQSYDVEHDRGYRGVPVHNITYINFNPNGRTQARASHLTNDTGGGNVNDGAVSGHFNEIGGHTQARPDFSRHNGQHRDKIRPLRSTESSEAVEGASSAFADMQLDSQAPRRRTFGPSRTSQNDNNRVFNRLSMFDTVFILDDTGSMDESVNSKDLHDTKRWEAAKQALKHIGKIATQKDLNGVDLGFLKADDVADNITDFDDLVDKLDSAELDEFGGGTFFQEQLEEIIHPRLIGSTEFRQQSEVYNAETRRRVPDGKANAHLKEAEFDCNHRRQCR